MKQPDRVPVRAAFWAIALAAPLALAPHPSAAQQGGASGAASGSAAAATSAAGSGSASPAGSGSASAAGSGSASAAASPAAMGAASGSTSGAASPAATGTADASAAVHTQRLQLERDLFVGQDFYLRGVLASSGVRFPWPRDWVAQPGSVLQVRLHHSSALVPERSNLSVRLNGAVIASAAYRADRTSATLEFPLPPEALRPLNYLEFVAVQHLAAECENPFDEALWSSISRLSELRLRYRVAHREPTLADYPLPLVDDRAVSPARIAVLRPAEVDEVSLTELARVLAGLGQSAQWRPVRLGAVDTAADNVAPDASLIAVGTAVQLAALAGQRLPYPLQKLAPGPRFVDQSGAPIPDGVGVLQLVARPGAPGRALLVVGGNDAAGVQRAAVALTEGAHGQALAGQARLVTDVQRGPAPAQTDVAVGTFPRGQTTMTFDALGVEETTVRRALTRDVGVDFRFAPDERPSAKKHDLRVVYSYGAGLNPRASSLELILNQVSLGGARLASSLGEQRAELTVQVPPRLLQRRNLLVVRFHLMPEEASSCEFLSQDALWATLHPESSLTVERDRWVELPDLSLLQHGLFPFADPPDLSRTALLLGPQAGREAFRSFAALALALGRESRARRFDLVAARAFGPATAGRHVLAVEDGRGPPQGPGPEAQRRLRALGSSGALTRAIPNAALATANEAGFGVLEEVMPPGAEQAVLYVAGQRDELLAAATDALTDPKRRGQLAGAAMVIHPGEDQPPRAFEAVSPQVLGTRPAGIAVSSWLRTYYWPVLGLSLAGLFGAVLGYRRLRQRRLQARLHGEKPPATPTGAP